MKPLRSLLGVGYSLAFQARKRLRAPERPEDWDQAYRAGEWGRLDTAGEVAHYMVVVGYTQQLFENPSVLDIGCGHGRLLELLLHFPLRAYVGVDLSPEAIRRAQKWAAPERQFVVANYEHYVPAALFDAIVFNESLHYAADPAGVLRRYAGALSDGGRFLVSMFRHRWRNVVWREVGRFFETAHATTVVNERGLNWEIRVLKPR